MAFVGSDSDGQHMENQSEQLWLRMFPLKSVVLFPDMELPLVIFEERYKLLISECLASNEPFGVLLLRSGEEVGDHEAQPYDIGTTAEIVKVDSSDQDRIHITAIGKNRFRVLALDSSHSYLSGIIEYFDEETQPAVSEEIIQTAREVSTLYLQALVASRGGYVRTVNLPDSPSELSYLMGMLLQEQNDQQVILEIDSIETRLHRVTQSLRSNLYLAKQQVTDHWNTTNHSAN